MSSQALFNNLDVPESPEPWTQVDSSSKGLRLTRDLESMGRPYAVQDETKSLSSSQGPYPASSSTVSTAAGSNVRESGAPGYGLKPILPGRVLRPQDRFVSLHKWEGIVLAVQRDSFLARLIDLTQGSPEEEGEFSLNDVSGEDMPLLKPGAIFYWNIGYHDSRTGQRRKVSEIRFRRLPAWTAREIEAARREASRLRDVIGWE